MNALGSAVWNALRIGKGVHNLWSYDAEGVHWAVTGHVDRKRRGVYGLEIHAWKGSVGVIRWCEGLLYGDPKIKGVSIIEATDLMEGVAIPEGYQMLKVPAPTEQPSGPFELRIKPIPEPGAANLDGVSTNGDLEATIKATVERQVDGRLVDVLEKTVADLKASLGNQLCGVRPYYHRCMLCLLSLY